LLAPFRYVWDRFYHASPFFQILMVAIFAGGGLVAGISAYYFYNRQKIGIEWSSGWRDYIEAKDRSDVDGMKAGLDRALAVRPSDAVAARKRNDLEIEEADPEDAEIAIVLMNHHMKANRLHEMAREAGKVRRRFPNDWRSICIQAHYEWHRNGVAAAVKRLQELPSPEEPSARIDVGGLLYSLQLFENMGRDASELRGLIVRRLLPVLRGGSAANASPTVKINLVECYLEPFSDPINREVLANYWADASKLVDLSTETALEEVDIPLLIRIGRLGPKMINALQGLKIRQNLTIPEERFKLLRQEIEDRSQRVWDAVLAQDPGRVEAHLGLINIAWATGEVSKISQAIDNAFKACGERTEILAQLSDLGVRLNRADAVLGPIWAAAERSPRDVNKWFLAATVARHANRRDKVIEACEIGRRLDPTNLRFALLEADWFLEQEQPEKALSLLSFDPFKSLVLREPEFIRRQARALASKGEPAEPYLKAIDATALEEKRPPIPLLFAALVGTFQALPPKAERDAFVARLAGELAKREPNGATATPANELAASALTRRAEYVTPPWQREAVHDALQAIDLLPADTKLSPQVRLITAKLRLKGMGDASQAEIDAAPLLQDRFNATIPPDALEVLGLILLENRKVDEAVKLLEYAAERPGATTGVWIALARARQAVGRDVEARTALDHPHKKLMKFSPREDLEWTAAAKTLK